MGAFNTQSGPVSSGYDFSFEGSGYFGYSGYLGYLARALNPLACMFCVNLMQGDGLGL